MARDIGASESAVPSGAAVRIPMLHGSCKGAQRLQFVVAKRIKRALVRLHIGSRDSAEHFHVWGHGKADAKAP